MVFSLPSGIRHACTKRLLGALVGAAVWLCCTPPPATAQSQFNTGSPAPMQQGHDECAYENDGMCDVPHICASGDYKDCGTNPPPMDPEDAFREATDPCACSVNGTSGGTPVPNIGCADHLNSSGPFCWTLMGTQCSWARPSVSRPGAAWRSCRPSGTHDALEDPCQYTGDGMCDVPRFCAVGDYHDCANATATGHFMGPICPPSVSTVGQQTSVYYPIRDSEVMPSLCCSDNECVVPSDGEWAYTFQTYDALTVSS